jgi:hypothetical protein
MRHQNRARPVIPIHAPELHARCKACTCSPQPVRDIRVAKPFSVFAYCALSHSFAHMRRIDRVLSTSVGLAPGLRCRNLGLFSRRVLFRVDLEEVI